MSLALILGGLTLAAVIYVLWPLLRGANAPDRAVYDIEVYRAQLAEIERDQTRGLIATAEYAAARREIEHRLLAAAAILEAADQAPGKTGKRASKAARRRLTKRTAARGLALVITVLLVPASAALLYGRLGSPGIPNQPFADRPAVTEAASADEQRRALVRDLQDRTAANPDDAEAWLNLGRANVVLMDYEAAVTAFERAVDLTGRAPEAVAMLGEAHVFLAQGFVTEAARSAFLEATSGDANEGRAVFYLGVADYQAGRAVQALDRWIALARTAAADAPWLPTVRARIAATAREVGRDEVALLATLPVPGETATAAAPPQVPDAAPDADDFTLEAMTARVADLAARLAGDPDDLEGWLMLGRSYFVLDRPGDALEAFTQALAVDGQNMDALTGHLTALANLAPDDAALQPALTAAIANVLTRDPDSIDALWFAGAQAFQSGDTEVARDHWARLLDLLPPEGRESALVAAQLARLP